MSVKSKQLINIKLIINFLSIRGPNMMMNNKGIKKQLSCDII